MSADRLLTAAEVAERLGVSPETVLRRYRRGELAGFRLSSNCLRFDPDEVRRWLDERRGPHARPRPLEMTSNEEADAPS